MFSLTLQVTLVFAIVPGIMGLPARFVGVRRQSSNRIGNEPMWSTTVRSLGPRLALGAVIIAASIALVGCGTVTMHTTHATHTPATPRPSATPSHFTVTPSTAGSDVYSDALAGYSVTFPGQPDVRPLEISGTHRLANIALYGDPTTIALVSRGEVRNSPPDLQGELFAWLQSIKTTGSVGASGGELYGLPDADAQFTEGSQQGETIMLGDGKRFYQLIAVGGTAKERQAFFDSFRLTRGKVG